MVGRSTAAGYRLPTMVAAILASARSGDDGIELSEDRMEVGGDAFVEAGESGGEGDVAWRGRGGPVEGQAVASRAEEMARQGNDRTGPGGLPRAGGPGGAAGRQGRGV